MAAFRIPIFLDRINKDAEAADLFMDYAKNYPQDEHADDALERGVWIVLNELRKDPATADLPETVRRYDRASGDGRRPWARRVRVCFGPAGTQG